MLELMNRKIWVCWNYVEVEGRETKMPLSAYGTKTGSDAAHARTWVTYDEAKEAAERNGYSGVAFVIPDGYFFLDIDHKDVSDSLVKIMLNRFRSYAEISVSGDGIHIYGKCDREQVPTYKDSKGIVRLAKEFYLKNPSNGMELYIGGLTNRFAIYTGNVVMNEPLRDCTQAVLTTLDKDMRRQPKVKYQAKHNDDKKDFDIVSIMRNQKNGAKFSRLYDNGDFTGYASHSEADVALCSLIAFRTGPDPVAIDEIFRSSALYRDKWEREDYRRNTISAGIESCQGDFYKTGFPAATLPTISAGIEANNGNFEGVLKEHPYFIRFDSKGKSYVVAPLLARYVREHLDYIFVRESGNESLLKYVYEDGVYRLYADDMLLGIIKQYIADYDEELIHMATVKEVFQLITTDIDYVGRDDLDADESIINFQNGLLKVTETELYMIPHTPNVLSTIQIPCEWTGKPSPTPVFDAFMHTLTNGNAAVKQLFLEYIGACISNIKGWRMKKSLFMIGDGDTGKSKLKKLVEDLIGKGNYSGIDLKTIEARFGTGTVYGKRLVGSSDMSFLSIKEMKIFKQLTGGDSVFAEFKGQQPFEFTYNGYTWFCANRLPRFGGDDGKWVYDRIMVVDCPNVIPKDKQDKRLPEKMYAERDGIVYKAVTALQTVIKNGYFFSEPASVLHARDTYKKENNTVIGFFLECMCSRSDGSTGHRFTTGRIYRVYQAWCKENNNGYAKTMREFQKALAEYLGRPYADITTRSNGNTYFRDYFLTKEAEAHFSRELKS